MMRQHHGLTLSRRLFLGGALGSMAAAATAHAADDILVGPAPTATSDQTTKLIVAGSAETPCGAWASRLAPDMAEELGQQPFDLTFTTGWDGVTGANLFDAQEQLSTASSTLLVPGTALMAAMTGDSRVHYAYQRWLPVLTICQPSVVVGHVSLHRSLGVILSSKTTRIAVSTPTGPELPTLLAFDLLALRPLPVSGYATPDAAMAALTGGLVDAIQLPMDAALKERLDTLATKGFVPLFLNTVAPPVPTPADMVLPPTFPTILLQERRTSTPAFLPQAWQAIASAASLKAALVLPLLTSPAKVARWRHAAETCAAKLNLQQIALANGQTVLSGAKCIASYGMATPDVNVGMALRRWLALNLPRWRSTPVPPAQPLPPAPAQ
ncbi:hypothetical protein [Acetobacter fabarum]|uniref:hypothetical protein n=1 Tax=Acetobacter fabarum TaxID=483199 RepID=UPI0020A16B5E|nr:hypothetical protein [Acetobacter fabarum]MCP1227003.1 hypothetical protein [Acetobacter fabarum]MCP1232517.1 hypothetical protein [Acetobacter fabarum]